MKNLYTNETLELLNKRIGYRNENCYGSGVIDFKEILEFEVFELGNIDILETCRKLYSLKLDLRSKKKSVAIVLNFLYNHYKVKNLYGLWLATLKDVRQYCENNDFSINKYIIDKSALLVSDLGPDGALFVNFKPFQCISN